MTNPHGIPDLPGFDSTAAFLREGYGFVAGRCDALQTDAFRTRLMLRPVTCIKGAEAVRAFYHPGRMTRRGAMPRQVVALLQDKGSVQTLDGAAHRVRKTMFMDLMTPGRLDSARRIFAEEWNSTARSWQGCEIALREAVDGVMTRTALRWCGIDPAGEDVAARTVELSAMFSAAGSLGPGYLRARWLRARSERWARGVVAAARQRTDADADAANPRDDDVVGLLATHRDVDGSKMSAAAAAVELLNLLRPIVAVGRYVVFAAHALHVRRVAVQDVASNEEGNRAIGEEIRRFYPFFPVIGGRVLSAFDWHGARFDVGDWVLLDLYGTNRDPVAWPEPDSFRPERHLGRGGCPVALVPQGGGDYLEGHRCPGEPLTVALLTEAVARLRALEWTLPQQDLTLPPNEFPPLPRGGMMISVAPSRPGASC